jgi:3-keto-5-aminohexanoate cleavage enzyme
MITLSQVIPALCRAPRRSATICADMASTEAAVRERLRALRRDRGLTQAVVAGRAGMAPSTLSRLESGARRLTLDHLAPLAAALGVAVADLLAPVAAPDPRVRARRRTVEGLGYRAGGGPGDLRSERRAGAPAHAPLSHLGSCARPAMTLDDPVILTCAISGAVAGRDQCPAIPYTPDEYAAEARRIVDEGGSMIHIHARRPDGTPSHEVHDFRAITEAIVAEAGDVVINYSTGAVGVPVEKRIAYLRELRPDVAALNMGSMNYAKYSPRRREFVFEVVFENSFDTIIALLEAMNDCGIRPEHECFDSGHLANLDPLLDMGLLSSPLQVSCVLGVTGGIRPTARNLAHMAEQVPDVPHQWGVIGISRGQWRLVAAALALGGNVRVGLEDNFYLPDGTMARSNGELVAKARAMAEDAGRRVATIAEARELLGVVRDRA